MPRFPRVQLALNVSNLERSVEFYSKLFGVEPAKLRPGYANFAVDEPPLKLVLIENPAIREADGLRGALNHLGVELASSVEVSDAAARLSGMGMDPSAEDGVTCCYANQDKAWVTDPDGSPWELYTVLADAPVESGIRGDGRCCVASEEVQDAEPAAVRSCCPV